MDAACGRLHPLIGQWRISLRFRWIYHYFVDPKELVLATFEDGGEAYIDAEGNPYGPLRYTDIES